MFNISISELLLKGLYTSGVMFAEIQPYFVRMKRYYRNQPVCHYTGV